MQQPTRSPSQRPDIDDDVAFQHRVWRFERIGWFIMGLIILAALLGYAGHGLYSGAEEGDDRLRIEYPRFTRHLSPAQMKIHVGADAVEGGAVTLLLNEDFADSFEIDNVVPMPAQWQAGAGGVRMRIPMRGDAPGVVRIYMTPQGFGPVSTQVGIDGAPALELWQFIYP